MESTKDRKYLTLGFAVKILGERFATDKTSNSKLPFLIGNVVNPEISIRY
jgi:hypothetical protein